MRRRDLSVQRYVLGGLVAGADRHACPAFATPMFAVIVWADGSHNATGTKPGPLGLTGGST